METNSSSLGEERRKSERRADPTPGSISTEAEVWILKTKVDMLTDSLGDIKETLRRIVEIVGVISIMEVNAKQLSKESALLSTAVEVLQEQVTSLERSSGLDVDNMEEKLSAKIKAVDTELTTQVKGWTEKYNIARGMWLIVSAISTVVLGAAVVYVKDYTTKVNELYVWMDHQKIEASILRAQQQNSSKKAQEP